MSLVPCLASGILGSAITLFLTPWLIEHRARFNARRQRDLHHGVGPEISRLGGVSLAAGYILILVYLTAIGQAQGEWLVATAPLAIFAVGLWDDIQSLSARAKLTGQLLIALAVANAGVTLDVQEPWLFEPLLAIRTYRVILTVVWLVAFTNLVNLADGMDGLAVSLAIIGMAVVASLASAGIAVACLSVGMLGALAGLLRYNFPPARIYIGDGGAYFLGFLLGLFSLLGFRASHNAAELILPLMGLVLPILDTLLAVARRALCGLPLFRPDRHHLHHELVKAGLSPRRVLLWYTLVTASGLCAASAALFCIQGYLLFGLSLGACLTIVVCVLKQQNLIKWNVLARNLRGSVAMRQQIAYALCLRAWLRHEAERCCSVEELFADLRLAARRLGFTSVRLALGDGYRVWKEPPVCGHMLLTRHHLQNGNLGILELEAPRCCFDTRRDGPSANCADCCTVEFKDPKLLELLSEVLAESWVEATRTWGVGQVQLRFDHPLPHILGVQRRQPVANAVDIAHTAAWQGNRVAGASSVPRLLRRTCVLAITAILLLSAEPTRGGEAEPALQSLNRVPRVEWPARAARIIKQATPADRCELIRKLIQLTKRVHPTVVAPLVGSIARDFPKLAPVAAAAAVVEEPENASIIATAAVGSARSQTKAIVCIVLQEVPADYRKVALSVAEAVPDSSRDVLEAVSLTFPELRATIHSKLNQINDRPSVSAVLDSILSSSVPKPMLDRTGIPRLRDSPEPHPPSVGPPFVPLSGTATNITSATSGTVPKGGRNYARP